MSRQFFTDVRAGKFLPVVLAAILVLPAAGAMGGPPKKSASSRATYPPPATHPLAMAEQISQQVASLEQRSHAAVGVSAIDLSTGKELLAIRQNELFIPASNMKLLTSCFALARLGDKFQFRTVAYLLGKDLVVVGDFDPTLGDPVLAQAAGKSIYSELDQWTVFIKKQLGGKGCGDILLVTRGSEKSYRHKDWPRNQYERWYGAPVSELNFNNNCLDVSFQVQGVQATPVLSPTSRFLNVVNNARPAKKALWTVRLTDDDATVTVGGTVSGGGDPVSVAVNDPPLLLGRVLADRLELAGVRVGGKIRAVDPSQIDLSKAQAIVQTRTPLAVAIARANKRSLNMAAECIFLRAGDGTWEGSAKLAGATLKETFGLSPDSFSISDGSGFSRNDRVTPSAMTRMLLGAMRLKGASILLQSLPVSGIDGTLSKRFDEKYHGRILGKTGYIAGASCLSGFVLDKDNRPAVAYSVLVNKCSDLGGAKRLEESVAQTLADYVDSGKK